MRRLCGGDGDGGNGGNGGGGSESKRIRARASSRPAAVARGGGRNEDRIGWRGGGSGVMNFSCSSSIASRCSLVVAKNFSLDRNDLNRSRLRARAKNRLHNLSGCVNYFRRWMEAIFWLACAWLLVAALSYFFVTRVGTGASTNVVGGGGEQATRLAFSSAVMSANET